MFGCLAHAYLSTVARDVNDRWADWLRRRMRQCGYANPSELDRASGVDQSVISRWLNEGRTPQVAQLRKMTTALDVTMPQLLVAAGYVEHEELGGDTTVPHDVISDVADAILRDTELLEEAKEHLLKQYQLLRRLPPQKTSPTSADAQEPPRPVVPPPDHTEGAREGVRRIRDETRRAHGIEDERKHKRGTGTRDS
jgi:transcriptional regulator with XRE-family HTH domain